MQYNSIIPGKKVDLRMVEENDAEFILSLRLDPNLNKFISPTKNSVEEQINWIRRQKLIQDDYYFIIQQKDKTPLGTISLYNIKETVGEFGRWISKGNQVENLESAVLIHKFAFEELKLKEVITLTVSSNQKVLSFHKSFGAIVTDEVTYREDVRLYVRKAFVKTEEFSDIYNKNMKIINLF